MLEGIFIGRYSYQQVFDCQRSPSIPVTDESFSVSYFALPYDATIENRGIIFKQGDIEDNIFYIKTSSIEGAPFALYMADDVNGTNESAVSVSGKIYGLGKEGFLYVDEDQDLGYLISNTKTYIYGEGFTYDPDIEGPITLEDARDYHYGNGTPKEKVMTLITVQTAHKKQTYLEGEKFDTARLVIILNYDDDSEYKVEYAGNESLFKFRPSLSTPLSALDNQIVIEYGSKTVTLVITVDFSVTYNLNGGESGNPQGSKVYKQGDKVDVNFSSTPLRTGYKFLGWDRIDTAETPEFTMQGTKIFNMGNSNVTLYAVWQEKSTVSIDESVQSSNRYDGDAKEYQIISTTSTG